MTIQRLFLLAALSCAIMGNGIRPSELCAQSEHSDIRFFYSEGQVVVETGGTPGVASSEFPVDGLFRQFESNPGFASENDVGFGINAGDTIVYNVLEDLLFWNGSGFAPPAIDTQIRIENNGSDDTIVHGDSGVLLGEHAPFVNGIGIADGIGDFHSHVDFFLEPNSALPPPDFGAYGLKLSLSTSAIGIAESDPFFIVFNFDLETSEFADAIEQYALLLNSSLEGDFDNDGDADGQDFLLWQREAMTNPSAAADLLAWQESYGTDSTILASAIIAAPEPTAGLLVLLGSLSALLIRPPFRCCVVLLGKHDA